MKYILALWHLWAHHDDVETPMLSYHSSRLPKQEVKKVEDYRQGYPRFSALLASHDSFFVFRPFRRIRARILLLKRDKIAILEEKLDRVDSEESCPLFLGASRYDKNTSRVAILNELESHLADYDSLLERSHRILSLNRASSRDLLSLQHWVKGNSCLNRAETAYLEKEREMINLSPSSDSAMNKLEDWTEDQFIRHYARFREIDLHEASTDPRVYIYSGPLIHRTAQTLMLLLITSLLLVPVVICVLVDSKPARIFIIIISTAIYLSILSHLTKSKMIELILAAATFATILTVFISNTD
ncbi:hypothetical protein F5Y10DRAFT_291580 [Nemania abortiva]|nr:hypothetical protein F5Y10DRAFT_291580 [Nemania abortiva]